MTAPARGLSAEEAGRRLRDSGPNELARGEVASEWSVARAQFEGAMIWLLAAAAGLSAVPGDVLLLEGGDVVAADARLVEAYVSIIELAKLGAR